MNMYSGFAPSGCESLKAINCVTDPDANYTIRFNCKKFDVKRLGDRIRTAIGHN